ncbi:hypothetical protein G7081_00210 [Vagococcus coleopterorum]|uniref:Uncharacterized protein n=1 Tax=Vagococcus coleopterorum TaxID=2714946 RepID=A0A6G8AKV2_9ENTE|nr:hypothetical protein [Vagococcus coleopterorum]QIL45617.1 hypothetical protein G7081_00210 [Vagococcus coleopterorum]
MLNTGFEKLNNFILFLIKIGYVILIPVAILKWLARPLFYFFTRNKELPSLPFSLSPEQTATYVVNYLAVYFLALVILYAFGKLFFEMTTKETYLTFQPFDIFLNHLFTLFQSLGTLIVQGVLIYYFVTNTSYLPETVTATWNLIDSYGMFQQLFIQVAGLMFVMGSLLIFKSNSITFRNYYY